LRSLKGKENPNHPRKVASTSEIQKILKKLPMIEKNRRKLEQFSDFESEL
jgi:hypothetical protein